MSAALAGGAAAGARGKKVPVGLELYSVRDVLKDDLMGVVKDVAKMGYDGVEFYSPYYDWSPAYAKQVRALLDDLGIKCFSTHNGGKSYAADGIDKAIELNSIIGSKMIVLAGAGRVEGQDGWRKVADLLTAGAEKMRPAGLRAGYHNHQSEFKVIDGWRPIEVLAKNTAKDVVLQLDVGTCVEVGYDPVAWINQNPGRIGSIHCKDFSKDPSKQYKVLFGDGDAPWKKIFAAAEKKGGVEYYLIEQEGYDKPSRETVALCLKNFRKIHG
jgi:sugar phosphate isomerase/epimerase